MTKRGHEEGRFAPDNRDKGWGLWLFDDDVDEKGFCSKGLWVTLQYDRLRNIEGWVSCRPHRNPIFWWSLWWGWASWWILKLARERIYDKNLIYWSESFIILGSFRGEQWAMSGLIFLRINLFEAGWHFSDCPLKPQLPPSCPLKPSRCPLYRWNCSKSTALIKLKAWINQMWYIKPAKSDCITKRNFEQPPAENPGNRKDKERMLVWKSGSLAGDEIEVVARAAKTTHCPLTVSAALPPA